jgi:LPS O-antigen subunit length determinant protein (WzzB/FepE family)
MPRITKKELSSGENFKAVNNLLSQSKAMQKVLSVFVKYFQYWKVFLETLTFSF